MIQVLGLGVIAAIVFYLQKYIYLRLWSKNLEAKLYFKTKELFEGETGYLKEVILNRKRLPLPMLMVKFQTSKNLQFEDSENANVSDRYYRNDVFQVNGGEKLTRTLSFVAKKRGYYRIDSMDLASTDLFMDSYMYLFHKINEEIYVYPKPFHSESFRRTLQQLNGEVLTKRNLMEDPFEYRGIREYQTYDDIKTINWKATAKTGDFKVNLKNYTSAKSVRILMNLEDSGIYKKEACVENSIRIAAGLARYFLGQGMRVSCYSNACDIINDQPLAVKEEAGTGQLKTIYRLLARLDLQKPVVNFCEIFGETLFKDRGATMTFVISPNQYEDFVDMMIRYKATGKQFVWFYPMLDVEKPELPEALLEDIKVVHIRE